MWARTINVRMSRAAPFSSSSFPSVINDRLVVELELCIRFSFTRVDDNRAWLMLTDRTAISRSPFAFSMSRLARLLVKSTQALFNQISQKASFSPLCIWWCWSETDNDQMNVHSPVQRQRDSVRVHEQQRRSRRSERQYRNPTLCYQWSSKGNGKALTIFFALTSNPIRTVCSIMQMQISSQAVIDALRMFICLVSVIFRW